MKPDNFAANLCPFSGIVKTGFDGVAKMIYLIIHAKGAEAEYAIIYGIELNSENDLSNCFFLLGSGTSRHHFT